MYRVTRRFEFEAAHRLLGYEGKCKHLHGHSYVAEVTVEGPELGKLGMLVDFGALKRLFGAWIDKYWDHNILLCRSDADMWEKMPELNGGKLPFSTCSNLPTAEVMARLLFVAGQEMLSLDKRVDLVKVRIQETTDCWAEYYEDKQPTG